MRGSAGTARVGVGQVAKSVVAKDHPFTPDRGKVFHKRVGKGIIGEVSLDIWEVAAVEFCFNQNHWDLLFPETQKG